MFAGLIFVIFASATKKNHETNDYDDDDEINQYQEMNLQA